MHKYFIVVFFSFLFFSCSPKKNKAIAIDVLLVPSEKMYAQSLHLNSLINQNNPNTIKLDENHIPHITLLQCFIKEEDLPKMNTALHGLFETIEDENLKTTSLFYDKSENESFAMISIEKSSALLELHKKVIEILNPYIVANGSKESFIPNPDGSPINEFTVAYVPEFVKKYSHENYDPHISLGVVQTKVLDSLAKNVFEPLSFQATFLSVYQLGDHGTAQQLLWKSK